MASTPNYPGTPRHGSAAISTANTNRDGTGTMGTVLAGVAAGTRVVEVVVQATGTTTAGMVRLFIDDGTTVRLVDEVPVSAITPSATVAAFRTIRRYDNLVLPSSSHSLKASTHNAESFVVHAVGQDY